MGRARESPFRTIPDMRLLHDNLLMVAGGVDDIAERMKDVAQEVEAAISD